MKGDSHTYMARIKVNRRSPILENNSSIRFNEDSNDIKRLIRSNGIYDRYDMNWGDRFARIGVIDPYNALTNTKEYIFITKPDLCLMTDSGAVHEVLSNNPFFVDAINRYKQSAFQLQGSASRGTSPFMCMLSNTVTSTLDLPGINADTIETGGNVMGTRIKYRSTSHKSDEDHSFNLEFEDNKYLDIYMIFKMWDEYEKLKWAGALDFTLPSALRWQNYIINKVLHDQVSIYKFVVADDGYRIVYYARITGCIPTSIPRDAFSDMTSTDSQKITVGWTGHFVRDMDPIIISQFNQLVSSRSKKARDLPIYDTDMHAFNERWAITPHIEIANITDSKKGNHREYFLRWRG